MFFGITSSLQHKWPYIQHITYNYNYMFAPLDRALSNSFQPAIFEINLVQEYLLKITSLMVSMSGLVVLQNIIEALLIHAASRAITSHAVVAILG